MKESQIVEWKLNWKDEWLKSICAFANTNGGTLIIGKDDTGKIVGIDDAKHLLESIPNKARDILGVYPEIHLHNEDEKDYLEIFTPRYQTLVSYRGGFYVRSGSTTLELKGDALSQMMLKRYGRTWDGLVSTNVKISELPNDALKIFRELSESSGRLDLNDLSVSNEELIEKLYLVDNNLLKNSAILLFHPTPQKFFPGAVIKIGHFYDNTEIRFHDEIQGNLFTQSQMVIDTLFIKYLKATVDYDGIVRIEKFPIPKYALREAILNAIIHRNYSTSTTIQIRVYSDKIEIWNPAILPEGWTSTESITSHPSSPQNPGIANAFFRAGEIEAWGRGIGKIISACRDIGAPVPQWKYDGTFLLTKLKFSNEYIEKIGAYADNNTEIQDTQQKSSITISEKFKRQNLILESFRRNPKLTPKDISSFFNIHLRTIQRDIAELTEQGRLNRPDDKKYITEDQDR
jgi:ATP-dependent DNA helicase RecG